MAARDYLGYERHDRHGKACHRFVRSGNEATLRKHIIEHPRGNGSASIGIRVTTAKTKPAAKAVVRKEKLSKNMLLFTNTMSIHKDETKVSLQESYFGCSI
ncbi:hypothetical protein Ddc_14440 [Ditylenchus destructor]|nr:hypothetical protein Ddc_14440 [Ditylenchus destructor]